MPIKNLTDNVQASFPHIGRIRKGAPMSKDANGKTSIGKDLEYFRFVSDRTEVQDDFKERYGDKPTVINAYLPYAEPLACFDTWKESWVAGGLVHRCDGETMTLWLDKDGKYKREPKPCTGGCKEVGRLALIIPELLEAGHVGFVILETHGKHDLMSIQASLLQAMKTQDDLRGILFRLYRIKEKISTPMGDGKRARREKSLVKIEPAAKWVVRQLQAAEATAMLQLPEPRKIDPETGEINPPELANIDPPDFDDGEFTESEEPEPISPLPKAHLCAECIRQGKPSTIVEIKAKSGIISAADIAKRSLDAFGEELCFTHAKAAKENLEALSQAASETPEMLF